ncbi:leishmanolysin-related zinc metalloendopeptidase [Saccharopolyspora sp. NPDC050642]|uniref:leishmanolysin-related zinc metalloendopeptidase n=1 Tax=Saccharopolyspora sp. NPDC050642 TaxID=3157099 RepID=UPI0033FB950C
MRSGQPRLHGLAAARSAAVQSEIIIILQRVSDNAARTFDRCASAGRGAMFETHLGWKGIFQTLSNFLFAEDVFAMTKSATGIRAVYTARADAGQAKAIAATASPFTIEVRFLGGLTEVQQAAFTQAADRWVRVIVGDLPEVEIDGDVIDDVLILAQGVRIDGPGRILGQAGPTHIRTAGSGASAFLPAKGAMSFDTDDLEKMEEEGTLDDVITHEMGHVLGVGGQLWSRKELLADEDSDNPTFTGRAAKQEYGRLRDGRPRAVPVENTGGAGTRGSHWRETVFRNELMSGFIAAKNNPLSRVTVASLQDLGYEVDMGAAEAYTLPNLLELAEEGTLVPHAAPVDLGIMLPTVPMELPAESLRR